METAGKNITNVVRLVKLLKIDGYCATETMGHTDCIKSSVSIAGYDWEICVYPAMMSRAPDGTPWVAVKLVFLSMTCPSIYPQGESVLPLDRSERRASLTIRSKERLVYIQPFLDTPLSGVVLAVRQRRLLTSSSSYLNRQASNIWLSQA
jgi:speckle-type POZ protein